MDINIVILTDPHVLMRPRVIVKPFAIRSNIRMKDRIEITSVTRPKQIIASTA